MQEGTKKKKLNKKCSVVRRLTVGPTGQWIVEAETRPGFEPGIS